MSSAFDRLLRGINLERKRTMLLIPLAKSFKELLAEESPKLVCRDGTKYVVDKEDLKRLRAIVPEPDVAILHLPIYIRPAPDLGDGFYRIVGASEDSKAARVLTRVVFNLLGIAPRTYLYAYEVQRLKRTIASLVFVMY